MNSMRLSIRLLNLIETENAQENSLYKKTDKSTE